MPDIDLTPELLGNSLSALITGERHNQILYLAVAATGFAAACGLFLWSWVRPGTANLLDVARNVAPLVPSTVCVPQIAGCASKIAQYRAIEILSRLSHERALKVLEGILSK
jgi:HAMP domain-containing protein